MVLKYGSFGNTGWANPLMDEIFKGNQNMVGLAQSYLPGTDTVMKAVNEVGKAGGGADKVFTPTTMQRITGFYDPKTGVTTQGIGQLGLGAVNSLLGGYLGMKQYGVAKKQLAFQQDAFNKNYEAQRSSYNRDIESRARDIASRERLGDDYVNDYVKKHSI